MNMTPKQIELAQAFAQKHNVDLFFVQELIVNVLESSEKAASTNSLKLGKKMSQEAKELYESVLKMDRSHVEKFSASDVQKWYSSPNGYANNVLARLEKEGIVRRNGFEPRKPGQRGKNVTLWEFCNKEES